MNNTEKKLDALIDALGFDVEQVSKVYINGVMYCGNESLIPVSTIDNIVHTIDYKFTKRDEPTINPLAEIFGKHSYVNPSTLLKLQIIGVLKRANKQPKKDAITLINAAIDEAFKNE
jgi:hypothetical protein